MERNSDAEDAMLRYVNLVVQRLEKDPAYETHPMLNALAMALHGVKDAAPDQTAMGTSGMGTELAYAVVVGKRGEGFDVKEVVDLNTGKALTPSAMTAVVDCEVLLDEQPDDVPVEDAVRIIRKAVREPKISLLRGKDVERALRLAKEMIRDGRMQGATAEVTAAILSASPREWENLPSGARALVGSIWGEKTGDKMVITPIEPTISKRKIRHTVSRVVQSLR